MVLNSSTLFVTFDIYQLPSTDAGPKSFLYIGIDVPAKLLAFRQHYNDATADAHWREGTNSGLANSVLILKIDLPARRDYCHDRH